jgi:hypothetical protein
MLDQNLQLFELKFLLFLIFFRFHVFYLNLFRLFFLSEGLLPATCDYCVDPAVPRCDAEMLPEVG